MLWIYGGFFSNRTWRIVIRNRIEFYIVQHSRVIERDEIRDSCLLAYYNLAEQYIVSGKYGQPASIDGVQVRYKGRRVLLINTMSPKEMLVMYMSKQVINSVESFIRYLSQYSVIGANYGVLDGCNFVDIIVG